LTLTDLNGNLLNVKEDDIIKERLEYDEFNRLTYYHNMENSNSAYYGYYGNDLRSYKEIEGEKTNFFYDTGKMLLPEKNGADTAYNFFAVGGIAGRISYNNEFRYMYKNEHHDVILEMDKTGNYRVDYEYDDYGKLKNEVVSNNPFRYTGEYFDSESGYYYLRARYYNPNTRSFISEDTYRGKIKKPLSLNYYSYCHGNPIMYADPTGHNPAAALALPAISSGSVYINPFVAAACAGTIAGQIVGRLIFQAHPQSPADYVIPNVPPPLIEDPNRYIHPNVPPDDIGDLSITTTPDQSGEFNNDVISTPDQSSEFNTKDSNIITAHGNSKNSTKPQHGYEISDTETGDVVITGISGSKLNKNGSSKRANQQVNKWNKEAGFEKYKAEVKVQDIQGRKAALDWEQANTDRLHDLGNTLNRHSRPKPYNWK